jgi:hypothetical protein
MLPNPTGYSVKTVSSTARGIFSNIPHDPHDDFILVREGLLPLGNYVQQPSDLVFYDDLIANSGFEKVAPQRQSRQSPEFKAKLVEQKIEPLYALRGYQTKYRQVPGPKFAYVQQEYKVPKLVFGTRSYLETRMEAIAVREGLNGAELVRFDNGTYDTALPQDGTIVAALPSPRNRSRPPGGVAVGVLNAARRRNNNSNSNKSKIAQNLRNGEGKFNWRAICNDDLIQRETDAENQIAAISPGMAGTSEEEFDQQLERERSTLEQKYRDALASLQKQEEVRVDAISKKRESAKQWYGRYRELYSPELLSFAQTVGKVRPSPRLCRDLRGAAQ